MKIILAQGNPGPDYTDTRHNVGFMAVDAYAVGHGTQWQPKARLKATVAEVTVGDEKVLLVKPTTFYNETGEAARKIIDFYKLDPATDLLVIHDDLALPFGTIRTRQQGSDAGNNGIKSLNAHIGENYHRLRVGTWNDKRSLTGDYDFVLSKFTSEEASQLKTTILPHVMQLIDDFTGGALAITSHTPSI